MGEWVGRGLAAHAPRPSRNELKADTCSALRARVSGYPPNVARINNDVQPFSDICGPTQRWT